MGWPVVLRENKTLQMNLNLPDFTLSLPTSSFYFPPPDLGKCTFIWKLVIIFVPISEFVV